MAFENTYTKPLETGQDLWDVCLQEYGTLEAAFLVLDDNPQYEIITELHPGDQFIFQNVVSENIVQNQGVMNHFRKNKTRLNNYHITG